MGRVTVVVAKASSSVMVTSKASPSVPSLVAASNVSVAASMILTSFSAPSARSQDKVIVTPYKGVTRSKPSLSGTIERAKSTVMACRAATTLGTCPLTRDDPICQDCPRDSADSTAVIAYASSPCSKESADRSSRSGRRVENSQCRIGQGQHKWCLNPALAPATSVAAEYRLAH